MAKPSKIIALWIIVCIILTLIPVNNALALDSVEIYVTQFSSGVLTVNWSNIEEMVGSIKVYTDSKNSDNSRTFEKIYNYDSSGFLNLAGLSFKSDSIYGLNFEFYTETNGGGTLINSGFLYFISKISFYAKPVKEEQEDMIGGGKRNGSNPKLNLKWNIPKVWIESKSNWDYASSADGINAINDNLYKFYPGQYDEIDKLDFKINISSDINKLISTPTEASIYVADQDGGYSAFVSNNDSEVAEVIDNEGILSFNLVGREDKYATIPESEENGLPDGDILPGTLYYMCIQPEFKDSLDSETTVLTVGSPLNQNASFLSGNVQYTYTPIKFEISKDSSGTVYLKIFKFNIGSLTLPKMYYEIQTGNNESIVGDWFINKTIDNSMFIGDFAVTLLTGINVDNLINYKIVVKSDSASNRMESGVIKYKISDDISRPPVTTGVKVVSKTLDPINLDVTNIKLSWDKPINWEAINNNTDPKDDIVYNIMINTVQEDDSSKNITLEVDGEKKQYKAIYRKIRHISSKGLIVNANSLEYTLKGSDLFTGEYMDDNYTVNGELESEEIANPEDYPTKLLPNKRYYAYIYTTRGSDRNLSGNELNFDRSVVFSFTTFTIGEREVPVPDDLRLITNEAEVEIDDSTGEISSIDNTVELSFNNINIDWDYLATANKTYTYEYDLFMGIEPDKLQLIGATDNLNSDVDFSDVEGSNVKKAKISMFLNSENYANFGNKLLPNTTYYFAVRARVLFEDDLGEMETRESIISAVLPVTTKKGDIKNENDSIIIPVAPTDFKIAVDKNGDRLITSSTAEFEWLHKENELNYEIIITSKYVNPTDKESDYEKDNLYEEFVKEIGKSIEIDLMDKSSEVTYNQDTKTIHLLVNEFIFPNKLYYFSIRSVNPVTENKSSWASIPVTTQAVEPPTNLEVLYKPEIYFTWFDNSPKDTIEDYTIMIKKDNKNYEVVNKSDQSIVKFGNYYYARVFNLESSSSYDVKVYKYDDETKLAYTTSGMSARDNSSQIEIRFDADSEFEYEVAIKNAIQKEYTTLSSVDYELYEDKAANQNTSDKFKYIMRINYIETEMPDGTIDHLPLKSNMKYFIKLRTVKRDTIDTTILAYSKYIGPVNTRTEFSQTEYDRSIIEEEKINKLNKLINGYTNNNYWYSKIDQVKKFFVRYDKLKNLIDNQEIGSCKLNLNKEKEDISEYQLFIPIDAIKRLNDKKVGLRINANEAEYNLKYNSLDYYKNRVINSDEMSENNDKFVRILINKEVFAENETPNGYKVSSNKNLLNADLWGTEKDYDEYNSLVEESLFDEKSGYVVVYKNILLNLIKDTKTEELNLIDDMINDIYDDFIKDISDKLEVDVFTDITNNSKESINEFDKSITAKLTYIDNVGKEIPIVNYSEANNLWRVLENGYLYIDKTVLFNIKKTGDFGIVTSKQEETNDTLSSAELKKYNKILDIYDIDKAFAVSYYEKPKLAVKASELITVYEKINNLNTTGSLNEKIKKYGFSKAFNITSETTIDKVTREQAAYVFVKIYSVKLGIPIDKIKAKKVLTIVDEDEISVKFLPKVFWCAEMEVLTISNGKVNPKQIIKRNELINGLSTLLKLCGEGV